MSAEVQVFMESVKECEAAGHYQSSSLSVFARTVQEKCNNITRTLKDKKRVVRGAMDFHNNYDKVQFLTLLAAG